MFMLYSITTNQEAFRALFGVTQDNSGNLPSMLSVFPDREAPVICNQAGGREMLKMRWGLPTHRNIPALTRISAIRCHRTGGVGPIRKAIRKITGRNRCLVPATCFSEYDDKPNPKSLKNPDGTPHLTAGKKDVVVCTKPIAAAIRLRRHLDRVARGTRHLSKPD